MIVFAYLLSPLLIRAVYFDFHEIAFAIPLIAWCIYLIDIKKFRWFFVCIALLLLTKENMSITVVFFGLYLLTQRYWKYGTITVVLGVAWFFIATKILIPYFAGEGGGFNYWTYDALGTDLPSAIINIITNPIAFFALLFSPAVKIITFIKTFGTFLGVSFLSPIILIAIPTILERFLSSNENYWQFNYHYGAVLAPIIAMAAVDGIYRIRNVSFIKKVYKKLTVSLGVVFVLIAAVIFLTTPMSYILNPYSYTVSSDVKAGHSILQKIPENSTVCTTNRIAPHLGAHDLKLVGFYDQPTEVLSCEFIVVSSNLDQSPELDVFLDTATSQGFFITYQSESWKIFARR